MPSSYKLQAATRLAATSKRPNEDHAIHEIFKATQSRDFEMDVELKPQHRMADELAAIYEDHDDLNDMIEVIESLGYKKMSGSGNVQNFSKKSPKPNQIIVITVITNPSRKTLYVSASEYNPRDENL